MSDDPRDRPQPGDSAGGVFGNLPDSRPGTRSPRRDSARATKPGEGDGPGATRKAARPKPRASSAPAAERPAAPKPASASPKPSRPATDEAEPAKQGGGLEDIAWAGVAAAAEAATIGVRLASRAIEALRGNAEKD